MTLDRIYEVMKKYYCTNAMKKIQIIELSLKKTKAMMTIFEQLNKGQLYTSWKQHKFWGRFSLIISDH